jgi:AraC-like DNA-binding protein
LVAEASRRADDGQLRLPPTADIRAHCLALRTRLRQGDAFAAQAAGGLLTAFLANLLATATVPPAPVDPLVGRTIEELQRSLFMPFSLSLLARTVGVSPSHLSRRFKRLTGDSLRRTWQRMRMEAAAQMLRDGRSSAQAVAAQLGFCDPSHLTRVCRRVLGTTPSELQGRRL